MDLNTLRYMLSRYPQLFPGAAPTPPGGPAAVPSLRGPQPGQMPYAQADPSYVDPSTPPPPTMDLSPEQRRAIRRSQMFRFGMNLLARSGSRPGTGGGLGRVVGDIGAAGAQLPATADLESQAEIGNAQRIQFNQQQDAIAQSRRDQGALRQILTAAAPQGNETPQQIVANLTRLMPQVMAYGSPQLVSAISEVVKTLGAAGSDRITNPNAQPGVNNERGTPWFGKRDMFVLQQAPDGTTRQVWLHTPPPSPERDPNQTEFTRGTQVQAAYLREAKDNLAHLGSAQLAIHAVKAAAAGDVSAQMALLEQYIRTFNAPGAVVRPGTIETLLEQLPSVGFKIQSKWQQYIQNKGALPADMVAQMGRMLVTAVHDDQSRLGEIRARYVKQAAKYQIPADLWVPAIPEIDTSDVTGNAGIPSAPPAAAGDMPSVIRKYPQRPQ